VSARFKAIAADTVDIIERGGYSSDGGWVDIGPDVVRAVTGTRLYLPSDPLPDLGEAVTPVIEVTGESTVEASRRVGPGAVALVFASARNPGGGAIVRNQPHLLDTVCATLDARAERVLRVAAAHGHRTLVLGAWGCGVFANVAADVASAFRTALSRVPAFQRVVFAVLDRTGTGPTYRTFADAFAC
jgi:hypothetical protein